MVTCRPGRPRQVNGRLAGYRVAAAAGAAAGDGRIVSRRRPLNALFCWPAQHNASAGEVEAGIEGQVGGSVCVRR